MFFRENGLRTALTAAAAILLAAAGPLSAQDPPTAVLDILKLPRTERIVIRRVAGPIALDGRIDEPGWAGLLPLCLVMQTPTFGEACSERTEALLGYDDEFIYVAGRLLDREPDRIQAPTRKRDAMVATSDWFGVLFDSFNDKENSLAFFTTPAGLRFDAAVFRDGQLGTTQDMPMNLSWNTFWDVAVARSGEGWFVEMRIPLSSLRFQAQGGDVVMGVTVFRWISRRNETDVFPAIPKNWGDMSAWKPSQAQETVWPGLRPRRPVYLTPYVLTGYEHTYELNDDETAYLEASGPKLELGLDFKYGLTGNLTFDATVNPDFAQVEADDVQVNLTRFSLFFPEKRLFFQERSSNFDYNMGGTNTLFYSRRIGLVDDEPVRIYGGARLVGRLGAWDVGFLDMQTAALDDTPSENFGVLRLRRQVINPYSYLGGMLTSRLGVDGSYGVDYGLDWIWRMAGDDYFTLQWAQTFKDGQTNRAFDLASGRVAVMWERRTTKGFGTTVRFSRTGDMFDPAMGFVMMDDYSAFYTRTLYGWFPGKDSALSNHDAFLEARFYIGQRDQRAPDRRDRAGLGVVGQERPGRDDPARLPHRQSPRAARDLRRRHRARRALRIRRRDVPTRDSAGPPPQRRVLRTGRRVFRRLARLGRRDADLVGHPGHRDRRHGPVQPGRVPGAGRVVRRPDRPVPHPGHAERQVLDERPGPVQRRRRHLRGQRALPLQPPRGDRRLPRLQRRPQHQPVGKIPLPAGLDRPGRLPEVQLHLRFLAPHFLTQS